MNGYIPEIIKSSDELLKTGGFDYAFCGGHAIDIHLNGKTLSDKFGYTHLDTDDFFWMPYTYKKAAQETII